MSVVMIDLEGPELAAAERAALAGEPIAGVCLFARNLRDREAARDLVAELRATAAGELVIAIDQEGGSVVRLRDVACAPAAMALGAVDDPELTRTLAAATGRALAAVGIDVDFAPVADVQSDPANPVIGDRSFGGAPDLVARHVEAFVAGLQGAGVAATLKHFPGHGDVAVDSHLDLPVLHADLARLRRLEWPPFAAGIAAGAAAVMSAHVLVPALDPEHPATLSRAAMHDVLRGELGFDGAVFTDALNMRALADRWSMAESAVLALQAGVDVPVSCGSLDEHLAVLRAVEGAERDGRLDPTRMAASRARLARLRRREAQAQAGPLAPLPDELRQMREAAARAVTAVGRPPRLAAGRPVALATVRGVVAGGAVEGAQGPTGHFAEALVAHGLPVRTWSPGQDVGESFGDGVQALVVASATRTPPQASSFDPVMPLIAEAQRRGLPSVHVVLWNPAAAAMLALPALLTYGVGRDAAAAAASALVSGEAPGVLPAPLPVRLPAGSS